MFAYDLVRTVEPLGEPNPDPLGVPDLALMLTDALVVVRPPQAHGHRDRQRLRRRRPRGLLRRAVRDDRRGPLAAGGPGAAAAPGAPDAERAAAPTFASNMTREQFEANVARIIEYIYAGDAFQVVPSQRWSAPVAGAGVLDLPRPAGRQPEPVHVLPGLRRLRDRRRQPRAADHRHRPPRRHPADRRHPPARRERRGGPRGWPRSCSPTRRSAPST